MKLEAVRYHDFSAGHRVVGHEGKCQYLHGHNYRIHFTIQSQIGLDEIGRVLDFSAIKMILCEWLEEHWDHKFLIWENDPFLPELAKLSPESIVALPFNPTAENMAQFLLKKAPHLLPPHVHLSKVVIEETRKCRVEAAL